MQWAAKEQKTDKDHAEGMSKDILPTYPVQILLDLAEENPHDSHVHDVLLFKLYRRKVSP